MKRNSRRLQVLDWVRARLEAGIRPTYREIGEGVGMSAVGAWKHVQMLMGEHKLKRLADGRFELPEVEDLSTVATDVLRGELARRGVTMDALEEPQLLFNEGQPCAANGCRNRVGRGKLMCREHWFRLPPNHRSSIMNAWAARQMRAFQEALEAARNYLGGYARVVERVR